MVQLKANAANAQSSSLFNFNSFMVQLKAALVFIYHLPSVLFQFLHGTIKSDTTTVTKVSIALFQFLHGTIKSVTAATTTTKSGTFQFLHGTIKSELLPAHENP